jgi:hypothetical protein
MASIKTRACALALLASFVGLASVHAAPIDSANKLFASPAPVGQKGSSASSSCAGEVPQGMVFADIDTLCPLVAEAGTARVQRDGNGDAYIAATIDGINYAVDVYNCNPECADLTFTASFEIDGLTEAQMNDWNRTRRFGNAFIRSDGDVVIQMAINTRHGIAVDTFRDDLIWWETVLNDYVSFIGFR